MARQQQRVSVRTVLAGAVAAATVAPSLGFSAHPDAYVSHPDLLRSLESPQLFGGAAAPSADRKIHDNQLWPKNTVYYMHAHNNVLNRTLIELAVDHWRRFTCLKFVEVDKTYTGYKVSVIAAAAKICATTPEGMVLAQPSMIMLHPGFCSLKDIIHEFGHAVGMTHEQSRPDRDTALILHLENVSPGVRGQYAQNPTTNTYGTPYDYYSIMQYESTSGTANGRIVMEPKHPLATYLIGTSKVLSHWDRFQIYSAYKCFDEYAQKCGIAPNYCNRGLIEYDDATKKCSCSCAEGTTGARCETVNTPYTDAIIAKHVVNDKLITEPRGVIKADEPNKVTLMNWFFRGPPCHTIHLELTKVNVGACDIHKYLYILFGDVNGPRGIIKCLAELKGKKELTIPSNRADMQYGVTNVTQKTPDGGFELSYEFRPDAKCDNTTKKPYECKEGSCPAPLSDDHMSVSQVGYFLDEMAKTHSEKVNIIKYAKTEKGNDLKVVLIKPYMKKRVRNARHIPNRENIWVESAAQSSSRMSTSVSLHLIHQLLTNCKANCDKNFYVVPLINPDGYENLLTNNSLLHKKNLKPTSKANCVGVNIYNNFWTPTNVASNADPCSQEYHGAGHMSEVENRFHTTLKKNVKNIRLTINLEQNGYQNIGIVGLPVSGAVGTDQEKSYVKKVADAFNSGVMKVPSSPAFRGMAIASNGTASLHNQKTYGHAFRVVLPQYGFPKPEKNVIPNNALRLIHGLEEMIKVLK